MLPGYAVAAITARDETIYPEKEMPTENFRIDTSPASNQEKILQYEKVKKADNTRDGRLVLLIEDDEMVRITSSAMLNRMGFTVIEATDGLKAIEVFRQNKDKLLFVLCDLKMPHMNGWETLAILRKLAPDTPLILSSGYFDPEIIKGDAPVFPQALLGKPFTFQELADTISLALAEERERKVS